MPLRFSGILNVLQSRWHHINHCGLMRKGQRQPQGHLSPDEGQVAPWPQCELPLYRSSSGEKGRELASSHVAQQQGHGNLTDFGPAGSASSDTGLRYEFRHSGGDMTFHIKLTLLIHFCRFYILLSSVMMFLFIVIYKPQAKKVKS